jgi:hypothetical protein
MWATQGCLQPFEFTGLSEEDRRKLESDLQRFLGSPVVVPNSADSSPAEQASTATAGSPE